MARTVVETLSGWVSSKTTTEEGLQFETSNFKLLRRLPTDLRRMIFTSPDGSVAFQNLSPEYASVEFAMINKLYITTR